MPSPIQSPVQSPKLTTNVLPSTVDNPEREARATAEMKEAKSEGAAGRDQLFDGVNNSAAAAGNSARAAGNRVTNWFTTGGHKTKVAAHDAIEAVDDRAAAAQQSAKGSIARFKSDCSAAWKAGAEGGTYARSTPANPTIGERIGGAIRAPFSGLSYIANHASSNVGHSVRESNWHVRLGKLATVAGAAAGVWAASFVTAGAAPRLMGWIIKPAPYTAGIASIPNLSAYSFYGSAAVLGAAIVVRLTAAVYAKMQEGGNAPASAPATGDNTIN